MWFDNTRVHETKRYQIEVFKIVNSYEDIDRNMLFKLKAASSNDSAHRESGSFMSRCVVCD